VQKSLSKYSVETGDAFVFNKLVRGVGDDETIIFSLENTVSRPFDNSDTSHIIIDELTVKSEGKTVIENIRNPSIDSDGVVEDVFNLSTNFSNNTIAELQSEPVLSGGDRLGQQLVGSGSTPGSSTGGSGEGVPSFFIGPGGVLAGEITNESGGDEDVAVRVVWHEVSENLVEEQPNS